jgi:stromal membrane-associated protein
MRSIGNVNSNAIYNPNELRHPPPPNLEDSERDSETEQYIRCKKLFHSNSIDSLLIVLSEKAKYQYKKFFDKSALVASKLGPSRSATRLLTPDPPTPPSSQPLVAKTPPATISDVPQRAVLGKTRTPESLVSNTKFANHFKPSATNKPTSVGGVWNDLSSLAGPGQDSSLPLQYQAPSRAQLSQDQIAMSNGNLSASLFSGSVTPTGMGMNTLQLQQTPTSPFPLQPAVSSNHPPLSATSFPTFFGTPPQQPFRQEVWGTASTHPSMIISQPTSTAPFFQPQPRTSFQVHTPSNQNFFSHSPSQQPLMSAPITQTQFFTPSPTHSHGPQLELAMPTQTSFFPSAQIGSMSVGHNPGVVAGSVGQSGFLATTTMQMQQQMLLQQQAQQQPVVTGMQPVMMTPNGMGGVGLSGGGLMYAQGQQWGIM